jgi:hypothetical protein
LPTNHRYINNIKAFFVGRVENNIAPPRLSGEELHDVVSEYGDIVFGFHFGKQKFHGLLVLILLVMGCHCHCCSFV